MCKYAYILKSNLGLLTILVVNIQTFKCLPNYLNLQFFFLELKIMNYSLKTLCDLKRATPLAGDILSPKDETLLWYEFPLVVDKFWKINFKCAA